MNREKFIENFEKFLNENQKKIKAAYTSLEELSKDPDFIADESFDDLERRWSS